MSIFKMTNTLTKSNYPMIRLIEFFGYHFFSRALKLEKHLFCVCVCKKSHFFKFFLFVQNIYRSLLYDSINHKIL